MRHLRQWQLDARLNWGNESGLQTPPTVKEPGLQTPPTVEAAQEFNSLKDG